MLGCIFYDIDGGGRHIPVTAITRVDITNGNTINLKLVDGEEIDIPYKINELDFHSRWNRAIGEIYDRTEKNQT